MMYNIFFSNFELGINHVRNKFKDVINKDSKVVILPWAFPKEITGDLLINDFFKKGSSRYNRYVNNLLSLDIKEENIIICNCYLDDKNELKDVINSCDILFLPGGNPEMFYEKVVYDTELLYDIKNFNRTIIGESAGAVLQFKKYFITAKNNYYKYFSFYPEFGILNVSFYIDVHSSFNNKYIQKLKSVAYSENKNIYAIGEDGVIIYNSKTKNIDLFGKVDIILSD